MKDWVRIPEERMKILKKNEEWIEELENLAGCKIELNEEVSIESEDPLKILRIKEVIKAFGRGFSFKDALSLLDEDYYADFALMDWCTRARGAGRRIVVEPGARVWTKNPSAISPLQARYLEVRNRPRFMLTHYPENMPEFEPRYVEEVRRMICDDFRAGRPRFAAAAWLGFDDFCEGRFGEGRIATLVETQGIAQWHLNAYDRAMLRAAALLDKIPFRNRLLRRFRRALGEHLADFPEIAYTTMEHTG